MSGKRNKAPVGVTTVFVVAVALLIGLEIIDHHVPAAWQVTGGWSVIRIFRFAGVPACFWMIVLVGLFVAFCIMWHEYLLPSPHSCRQCEYDRTGLPEGAVCPECGKAP